jgi:signal transduction histidine kinase
MSQEAYVLIGLTAIVAGLISVLVFAMLRFAAAARDAKRRARDQGGETALLSAALQEAVGRLRAQERASLARAEASERLNSEIVASLTAGLLVVGLDGDVRILNPAGRRLLGVVEAGGDARATYQQLLGPASPLTQVVQECLSTHRAIVRRPIELPDGSTATHLGVTASPLMDGEGRPAGAICLFTDLTAVMDLEEQLRMKDALARLGELTAGLAHEFRNGLATIHGYARLIAVDRLEEKEQRYVHGIRQETDVLQEIVTNFLNFARPAQLALAPMDLRRLVERVAEEARVDAESRGGSVEVAGDFAEVDGDEVLLRQAFSNLVRNALEACAGANTPPRIVLAGRVDRVHGAARITVTDNGPGIDPAVRERIFRPFVTTKRDGTGLGLALVQKIVVTHNGRVTAAPAAGPGASFEIVLPASAD